MLFHFIKLGFRNLRRNKFLGLLKVLGIAVGFSVALITGLYIYNELSYDSFQKEASNKFVITEKQWFGEYHFTTSTPCPLNGFVKELCPEVKLATSVNRLNNKGFIKTNDDYIDSGLDEFAFVDQNFFSFFSYRFLAGSLSEFKNTPSPAIISERIANTYFDGINTLGKTVTMRIEDKLFHFTVAGIIENPLSNTNFKFEFIGSVFHLHAVNEKPDYYSNWNEKCESYIQLISETHIEDFTNKISSYYQKNTSAKNEGKNELKLENIQQINLTTEVTKQLIIYGSLAILILIVSLINFVLLTTSENVQNLNQRVIEKISGAGRKEIIAEYFFSSLSPIIIAIVVSTLIIIVSEPFLQQIFSPHLEIISNLHLFGGGILLLGLISILITGSLKTLILSKQAPIELLKKKFKSGKQAKLISKSLLTFQLLSFIVLVIASFLMKKQLNFMQNSEVGFNKEFLISLKINNEDKEAFHVFKHELLKTPGIVNVAGTNCPPLINQRAVYGYVSTDSLGNKTLKQIEYIFSDKDYLNTMEMKLVAGEGFPNRDKGYCIVNRAFIEEREMDSPVGSTVELGGKNYIIAGVLSDFFQHSFHEKINPFVIYMNSENVSHALIRILPGNMQTIIAQIKKIAKSTLPETPFDFHFMDDLIKKQYETEQKSSQLVMSLSIIAILISFFGLMGLSFLNAQNRIKEIGIRKVNGAKISEILSMLNKDFIKWVAIAFVIACPIAYYVMNKWLENFAYKTTLSWWIFALAGVLALGIALLTVSWQSWRAATRNPVEALRYQ